MKSGSLQMTFGAIGRSVQTLAQGKPNADGGKPGGTDALTWRPGSFALAPAEQDRIGAWLAARSPETVDAAAVSRALSHNVRLQVTMTGTAIRDDRGNVTDFETFATGCKIAATPDAIEAAMADMQRFMTPAPVRVIEQWLSELSVLVARKADDDMGDGLRLTAYTARLSRYPADVVRKALLGRSWRFWPTWEELEQVCERLASPRRHMLAAMHRGPERQEKYRAPTAEERARIQDMINEMFPQHSAEMRRSAVDEALRGDCFREDG